MSRLLEILNLPVHIDILARRAPMGQMGAGGHDSVEQELCEI
jgi:hypothetical protein